MHWYLPIYPIFKNEIINKILRKYFKNTLLHVETGSEYSFSENRELSTALLWFLKKTFALYSDIVKNERYGGLLIFPSVYRVFWRGLEVA